MSPQWSPWPPEHSVIKEFVGVTPVSHSVSATIGAMQTHLPPETGDTIQPQQSTSGELNELDICSGAVTDVDESVAPSREDLPLQHLTLAIDETYTPTPSDSCRSETHNVSLPQRRVSPSANQTRPVEQQPSQQLRADKPTLSLADHLNKALQHLQQSHPEKALESLSQAFTELPSTKDDIDALNAILNIGFILANKADGILALECFGRALAGFERVHMSDEIVLALKGMAEISEEQGDCKSALDYYIRLLEVLEEAGDEQNAPGVLKCIARLSEDQQHYDLALEYYTRALAIVGDDFASVQTPSSI
jgi:hypothetical protein